MFPLSLYHDGYCAICISTYSYAFWIPALLEHNQLQDKQQREDIIICTHERWKLKLFSSLEMLNRLESISKTIFHHRLYQLIY